VKLAGPTVCSAADTGSCGGGGCPPAPLRGWCPLGELQAAPSDAGVTLQRGCSVGCCKFRGVNKIRFPIALSEEKLCKEGGGEKVSFLQQLGL